MTTALRRAADDRLLGEDGAVALLAKMPGAVRRRAHKMLLTRRELERLDRSPHPAGPKLARAIRAVVDGTASPEERAWAGRIESLRRELLASTDELEIVDYGAVEPGMDVTSDEMYAGRHVHRRVGEICKSASKPPQWAFVLLELVRAFAPERCVELGTSLGISASYEAAALALNGSGRLTTLEGADAVAERARRNFESLGLDDRIEVVVGRFQDTLGPVLERVGPVDYAFVDGHHDRDATVAYFEQLTPRLAPEALLVFDDISWSAGMAEAWTTIRSSPGVTLSVDLFKVGVCVVGGPRVDRQRFTVAID